MTPRTVAGICTVALILAGCGKSKEHPVQPAVAPQQAQYRSSQNAAALHLNVGSAMGLVLQPSQFGSDAVLKPTDRGVALERANVTLKRSDIPRFSNANDPRLVRSFEPEPGTVIVRLRISEQEDPALLAAIRGVDQQGQPALADTTGATYRPVGFTRASANEITIAFNKKQPLATVLDAADLRASAPDRQLTLIFMVKAGAQVNQFRIGDALVASCEPPVSCEEQR